MRAKAGIFRDQPGETSARLVINREHRGSVFVVEPGAVAVEHAFCKTAGSGAGGKIVGSGGTPYEFQHYGELFFAFENSGPIRVKIKIFQEPARGRAADLHGHGLHPEAFNGVGLQRAHRRNLRE